MASGRHAILLLLCAALSLILGAAALGTAPAPPTAGTESPLAIASGLVEPPIEPTAAARATRAHPAPQVLLRTPSPAFIQALVDSTSRQRITATIQRLQDFETRYVGVDSCWAAGYWIEDRLRSYGYAEVRLDTFRTPSFQDSVDAMNVLAVKEGTTRADEYVVFGGHYDSITTDNFSDPFAPAPGANDNATGVAAVLEAARILSDVPTERSIIFAIWSGEEVGLWGSRHFVAGAVAESLDIVLYLNADSIGIHPDGSPQGIIASDPVSKAVAAFMADVAFSHVGYEFTTWIHPIGTSDHNSFWEAGYNVVDSDPSGWHPYDHTPDDVIDHLDLDMVRTIAALSVVGTAAVAGVVGEDPNLPPETSLVENCASTLTELTLRPRFEWDGVDFDGAIDAYEYAIEQPDATDAPREWTRLPGDQTSITLEDLAEDTYQFLIRAIDDAGAVDPTPSSHIFMTARRFPELTAETNFLPSPRRFVERWTGDDELAVDVFEGELLVFTVSADAGAYCGIADSVAFAWNDSSAWSEWIDAPFELVLRPSLDDTAVFLRTRDENGATTVGKIVLAPAPAPRDRPLLHVDDWHDTSVAEPVHDAFYELLLEGTDADEWDPLEHLDGRVPTLPPMEELGRYRTVLWTLDRFGGFLRPAQRESTYHAIEGYVRTGGNVILEGASALASFGGTDAYTYRPSYASGEFIHDHVGVDSLVNAGSNVNPAYPDAYGYAFLGGIAVSPGAFPDVPVDILGKWADGYDQYGGVPYCEVVRPTERTARLYLFDSYLNGTLDEKPCGTVHFPIDGTGSFAYLGFPLYYLVTDPAIEMVGGVLEAIEEYQEPSVLLFFEWAAETRSVDLSWYLNPPDGPLGCNVERKVGTRDSTGVYVRVNDALVMVADTGRYRLLDEGVSPGTTYAYRLEVVERWGGTTYHGPWQVEVPDDAPTDLLSAPYPNPSFGSVELSYGVADDHRWVDVAVYDVAGRRVKTIETRSASAGRYDVTWDGTNAADQRVAAGVYFLRARIGDASFERKVVMLK